MKKPSFITVQRDKIDSIDANVLQLLGERLQCTQAIGTYKKEQGLPIVQQGRWQEILDKAIVMGEDEGLTKDFVSAVFNAIHDESVRRQQLLQDNK